MNQKSPGSYSSLNGNWRAWAGAITCTLVLNLALFALIPTLMKPQTSPQSLGPMIPQIQLTRLKRKASEPVKKKPKSRVEEQQPKTLAKPRAARPAPALALALPFEVNTKLPGWSPDPGPARCHGKGFGYPES